MDARFPNGDDVLELAGELDLNSAEEMRDALLQLLEQSAHPQVDLAGVESCDLASLQLLRAAAVSAAKQGTPLTVTGADGAVEKACQGLGSSLAELLQGGH